MMSVINSKIFMFLAKTSSVENAIEIFETKITDDLGRKPTQRELAAYFVTYSTYALQAGDTPATEPCVAAAADWCRYNLGNRHEQTLICFCNLAILRDFQGNFKEAESFFYEVLKAWKDIGKSNDTNAMVCLNSLGTCYFRQRKYELAEDAFKDVIERRKLILGAQHKSTLSSMLNLAYVYEATGRYSLAEQLRKEVASQ